MVKAKRCVGPLNTGEICIINPIIHERNRGYFGSDFRDVSPESLGLTAKDDTSDIYFKIAEDHLHGRLPDPTSETYPRETYRLTKAQLNAVLSRIAQEGWVERRPGYGWSFSPMLTTPESLEQTYRVRLALEPAALLEPTYRLDPETTARCREAELRLLGAAIETDSPMRSMSAAYDSMRRLSAPPEIPSSWRRSGASTMCAACCRIAR